MRKRLLFLLGILIIVLAASGTYLWANAREALRERQVKAVVESFGGQMQKVSLLAPTTTVQAAISENYAAFISSELLTLWLADPSKAPGRLTSSPWPDRIEIAYVDQLSPTRYMISGHIIEIASAELENGSVAARRAITLSVEKEDDRWQITHVVLGAYEKEVPR